MIDRIFFPSQHGANLGGHDSRPAHANGETGHGVQEPNLQTG